MRVASTLIVVAAACHNETSSPSAPGERWSYRRSVKAIEHRQAADDSIAVPGARSILLTTGKPTPRAIVLLHGLTDSPRQFERLAYMLRADGNTVYVPRLPEHGLMNGTARMLGALNATQLRGIADSVSNEASGLGDSVIVVGLSMGGTIAAWIAQHRVATRVVLIAPAIEIGRIPSLLERPIVGLAVRLPSITHLSSPDTARPDRELGFNTRAVAQTVAFGESIRDDAAAAPPTTRSITVLVNAADRTVKTSATEALADAWSRHGASVSMFELPDSLRWPHNILDAPYRESNTPIVLGLLRRLIYGEPLPVWVHALPVNR